MTNTVKMPQLNAGEIYAGAIINPDGTGHHIILLPGDHDEANWTASLEWAKSIGGDLPDRVEQALLFRQLPEQFQGEWYWSNTQHATCSNFAWYLYFFNGAQDYDSKDIRRRARAVRRIVI